MQYTGRIKKVYPDNIEISRILTGIKKADQPGCDRAYFGSNGSYCTSSTINRYIKINVAIYDFEEIGKNKTFTFDIRDMIFKYYNRQKISDKLIELLI